MARNVIRQRVTGPLTPEAAEQYRRSVRDVEANKESIIARGKELLKQRETTNLQGLVTALRAVRMKKGVPAAEIAARLEMDAGNYSRLEGGQTNPTLQTLTRMADAIGVTVTVNVHDGIKGMRDV